MIESYYNALASYHKFMFHDWESSISRQAPILDGVIREFFGNDASTILDAACGIGTQSIGLAQLGYLVNATDISRSEIEMARAEATKRGLDIEFRVADMRQLTETYDRTFDVVLACDNAIPHLLSDDEIRQAFEQFYQCAGPAGGCIISVRDYANMERAGKKIYPRTTHEIPGGRLILFDLWEFEGDYYDFTTYIVEDKGQATADTRAIRGGRYYCVTLSRLENLLTQAGFRQVVTLKNRLYQPLMIGVKSPPRVNAGAARAADG